MGVFEGGTVGDGITSVGNVVEVAVGGISVYVEEGNKVALGSNVASRLALGDKVSVIGLHAANKSINQRKTLEIFLARKLEG